MFKIYSTTLSGNGRKVLALCHHLRLKPEVHEVNVYRGEGQTPEYLTINPAGKIPTLVENNFILSESNAILQYICEAYSDCQLFSKLPQEKAYIASWQFWEAAHWQPALTPVLAPLIGHKLFPETLPAPSDVPDWNNEQLQPLLSRLEAHLQNHAYLAGEKLTIADFSVAGMMTFFRTAGFPFDAYSNLTAWYGRIENLEAWQETENELWQ
jgi:glutathione S-transferase